MPDDTPTPFRPTDDEARALARSLLDTARTAALAVIDPETRGPFVSRIAFGRAQDGTCLSLLSDLAHHTRALRSDNRVSLLVGEPGPKGNPLTWPRLTLRATVRPIETAADRARMRDIWLAMHPKAKLYADFADFRFYCFALQDGHLNGGFGKAFVLDTNDLKIR